MSDSLAAPSISDDDPTQVARLALRAAQRALLNEAKALRARDALTDEDRCHLKHLLKAGRTPRRTPVAVLWDAVSSCQAASADWATRLGSSPTDADPAVLAASRSPRKTYRPRRIHRIPPATEPGDGTWTPPATDTAPAATLMDATKLETLGLRRQVIRLMANGVIARDAVQAVHLPASKARWAQRIYKQWRDHRPRLSPYLSLKFHHICRSSFTIIVAMDATRDTTPAHAVWAL